MHHSTSASPLTASSWFRNHRGLDKQVRCVLVGATVAAAIILASLPTDSRAQEIRVYTDSAAQLIRGFGGAFIEFWQPDLPADEVETAFGLEEGQIGLSILRLGINRDPSEWSENLEAAQKAKEMGALIFASPWHAPEDVLKQKINPGDADTVDINKYDAYAQHLSDFSSFMEDNGVELHAVSVQNEPDITEEWTGWTAENMVTFLRESAPIIRSGTRVMAPESFQFRRNFSDPILMDSLAAAHTDIIAGHIYGGGNSRYPLAEEMGKEVWMTEYLLNDYTGDGPNKTWDNWTDAEKWTQTMRMLRTMHVSMQSNMQAYVWWYLRRYYSLLGDGVLGETAGEVTKRGFGFSQFSRFVRPGYVRLHSWGPAARSYLKVYATAYMDTSTGKVVLVVINDESADKEVNFVFDQVVSGTFNRYITSVTQDVEQLDDVSAVNSTLTVTLPKQTITTFVSDRVSLVGNEAETEIPSGYGLDANYPNPFNRTTVIAYELPVTGDVSLKVFDVHGRTVKTLVDGQVRAGRHQVRFDASGLSAGVYFYTLSAGGVTVRKSMLLAR